jgi:ADP-ribosylglycohydrolase
MALGIVEVLRRLGRIDQYELANVFARRYAANIYRGYGPAAHEILAAIGHGIPWRNVSHAAFGGEGSMGNGSAMRIAPLGAYFAGDLALLTEQARLSAEVTHAHREGQAGGIAVAVAAAWAWQHRDEFRGGGSAGGRLLAAALEQTPSGLTHDGLVLAAGLPADAPPQRAADLLGNGRRVTCPDTVPFCLWTADRFLGDYESALWNTVGVGGDLDTTAAIVGGVVALAAPSLPEAWRAVREALK